MKICPPCLRAKKIIFILIVFWKRSSSSTYIFDGYLSGVLNVLSFVALILGVTLVLAVLVGTFAHKYDYTRRIFRESFEEVPIGLSDIKNLKGNIVSVQVDASNMPTWILYGKWKISDSSVNSTTNNSSGLKLTANFTMVSTNGTGEHRHRITDFELTSLTFTNRTATINGNASMISSGRGSMGLEPLITNIPVTVKIENLRTLSIDFDKKIVKDRFGELPIFGTVS